MNAEPRSEKPAVSAEEARRRYLNQTPTEGRVTVAAVMSSFNKIDDVRKNLESQRLQTINFDQMIVVDNASSDGTAAMMKAEFPEVELVVMADPSHGACETFNIGFKKAWTDFVAILDDDVELPPEWVEKIVDKFVSEPDTTAFISSKVVEPEMPDWYLDHPVVNSERYMATFRGCATMARRDVLERAGYYDERFFIYGNERDLSCRVLNLGYRILQYPNVSVKHGTPFGMKRSARSLYYHVRNLWLYLFKNVPVTQLARFFWLQFIGLLGLRRRSKLRSDAVGSIGAASTISQTPGGIWVCIRATCSGFWNLPYCLKHRAPCRADDFELPIK